jgi:hypothetical protein
MNAMDRIERDIALFESETEAGQNYILCGDFNARTNVKPDFVEFDADDYLPLETRNYQGTLRTRNQFLSMGTNCYNSVLRQACV